jgi:hypothetical protein
MSEDTIVGFGKKRLLSPIGVTFFATVRLEATLQ